jgi:CDP-diacylglycerol---glycerol-3-phosphate 3-phosphatidyltransferase
MARIVLAPVFFFFFTSHDPLLQQLSLVVFILAALTDWYDGVIARSYNAVTNLGKFLDPLADKVLTSLAFIAFATIGLVAWWMVIVIIIRDIVVTVLRSIAEIRDAHIITSKTAQWKTFLQMAALYYIMLLAIASATPWIAKRYGPTIESLLDPTVVFIIMLLVTALTLFTGIQYFYDNRVFIGGRNKSSEQTAD